MVETIWSSCSVRKSRAGSWKVGSREARGLLALGEGHRRRSPSARPRCQGIRRQLKPHRPRASTADSTATAVDRQRKSDSRKRHLPSQASACTVAAKELWSISIIDYPSTSSSPAPSTSAAAERQRLLRPPYPSTARASHNLLRKQSVELSRLLSFQSANDLAKNRQPSSRIVSRRSVLAERSSFATSRFARCHSDERFH